MITALLALVLSLIQGGSIICSESSLCEQNESLKFSIYFKNCITGHDKTKSYGHTHIIKIVEMKKNGNANKKLKVGMISQKR